MLARKSPSPNRRSEYLTREHVRCLPEGLHHLRDGVSIYAKMRTMLEPILNMWSLWTLSPTFLPMLARRSPALRDGVNVYTRTCTILAKISPSPARMCTILARSSPSLRDEVSVYTRTCTILARRSPSPARSCAILARRFPSLRDEVSIYARTCVILARRSPSPERLSEHLCGNL